MRAPFYRVRGNDLFVNSGLGYGDRGPMLRINAPPEVVFLTLRAGDSAAI